MACAVDSIDHLIGQRLRERRQAYGISMRMLGNAVGVSYQQIAKYEAGRNRISAARLFEIAHQLQVPIGYFFALPTHSQLRS